MARDDDKKSKPKSKAKPAPKKRGPKPGVKPLNIFEPNNKFWLARSKHGREAIFETPQKMEEAVLEYLDWNNNNPLYDYQVSGGDLVRVPKMRAMTMEGLTRFLGVNTRYFEQFKRRIKEEMLAFEQLENPTKEQADRNIINSEYSTVITGAEEMVFEQKFTGAAGGFLNANLISRHLGMLDKKEINHTNAGGAFQGQVTVYHLPDNGRPVMQPGGDELQPTKEEGQQ